MMLSDKARIVERTRGVHRLATTALTFNAHDVQGKFGERM